MGIAERTLRSHSVRRNLIRLAAYIDAAVRTNFDQPGGRASLSRPGTLRCSSKC
jgi:hypothetical protein